MTTERRGAAPRFGLWQQESQDVKVRPAICHTTEKKTGARSPDDQTLRS
jgi:hypothetical protein